MATVTTAGDAGDAVYAMAILQAMPEGPHAFFVEPKDDLTAVGRSENGATGLVNFIGDLVRFQPYISDFRLILPSDQPFWRSGGFRKNGLHRRNEPLMMAHLNHLNWTTGMGLKVDTSLPWLSVNGDDRAKGRIIINRTQRYQNKKFPWKEIVEHYGRRIAFVGLPHEHAIFSSEVAPVDHIPTRTLLEVAQLIKGSELFIGNQSCAFACAEGLKHPSIQETSTYIPDCVFWRDNCQHVWDGACTLPALDDIPEKRIHTKSLHVGLVSTGRTPPYGWQFPGTSYTTDFFEQMCDHVGTMSQHKGKSRKEVESAVKQASLDRCPDYYRPGQEGETVRQALHFAKNYTV